MLELSVHKTALWVTSAIMLNQGTVAVSPQLGWAPVLLFASSRRQRCKQVNGALPQRGLKTCWLQRTATASHGFSLALSPYRAVNYA